MDKEAVLTVLADDMGLTKTAINSHFNALKKRRGIVTPRGGSRRRNETMEVTVSFGERLSKIAEEMDAQLGKKDKHIEELKAERDEWKEKYYELQSSLKQAKKLAKLLVD